MGQGRLAETIADCHQAISRDPDYSKAYLRRARALGVSSFVLSQYTLYLSVLTWTVVGVPQSFFAVLNDVPTPFRRPPPRSPNIMGPVFPLLLSLRPIPCRLRSPMLPASETSATTSAALRPLPMRVRSTSSSREWWRPTGGKSVHTVLGVLCVHVRGLCVCVCVCVLGSDRRGSWELH